MDAPGNEVLGQEALELDPKRVVELHLAHGDDPNLARKAREVRDGARGQNDAPLDSAALGTSETFPVQMEIGHDRHGLASRHLAQKLLRVHAHRPQGHIVREKS